MRFKGENVLKPDHAHSCVAPATPAGCASLHLTSSPVFDATIEHLPNPGDTVALFPSKRRNAAPDLLRTGQEAGTWLRDHGIVATEKAEVDRLFREQGISAAQVNDAAVLQAARALGASEGIFLEEDIGLITFRSVSVATRQMAWTALGTYTDPCFDRDHYVFKQGFIRVESCQEDA